jgi:hypothetical protein
MKNSAINSFFNSASDPEVWEILNVPFLWKKMILNHLKWQLWVFPPPWTLVLPELGLAQLSHGFEPWEAKLS